jgi:hypothetical protein
MPSDVSLVDVRKSFRAIAGLESMTEMDNFFFEQSLNRAVQRAYDQSPSWPRYLVVSEERDINAYVLSGASASTSTSVNQNYKLVGSNDGNVGKLGTNIYQGVTTSTVIIYKNSSDAWVVETGAAVAIQSDGNYRVTAGTTQFTEADTLKKGVLENVEVWTPRAGSDILLIEPKNLIPSSQTGKNDIGEFIRIHRKQAFLNNSAVEYDFYVDSSGANILNITSTADGKAYITYKKKYSSSFTETSTDVPAEFFDYILYTVLSDFYTGDGQTEKAMIAEEAATKMLDRELFKLDTLSNRNTITKQFSTYVKHQSR